MTKAEHLVPSPTKSLALTGPIIRVLAEVQVHLHVVKVPEARVAVRVQREKKQLAKVKGQAVSMKVLHIAEAEAKPAVTLQVEAEVILEVGVKVLYEVGARATAIAGAGPEAGVTHTDVIQGHALDHILHAHAQDLLPEVLQYLVAEGLQVFWINGVSRVDSFSVHAH